MESFRQRASRAGNDCSVEAKQQAAQGRHHRALQQIGIEFHCALSTIAAVPCPLIATTILHTSRYPVSNSQESCMRSNFASLHRCGGYAHAFVSSSVVEQPLIL